MHIFLRGDIMTRDEIKDQVQNQVSKQVLKQVEVKTWENVAGRAKLLIWWHIQDLVREWMRWPVFDGMKSKTGKNQ